MNIKINDKENMSKIDKEFDKKFVKDLGKNVEPILKDPNGSVGPIKQFIKQKIREITDEMIGEEKEMVGHLGGYGDGSYQEEDVASCGYNQKRQEIIDIANKHLK